MTRKESLEIYEFIGATNEALAHINKDIKEIKENHLVHLNAKMDKIICTVAGSIIVGVLALTIKMIIG